MPEETTVVLTGRRVPGELVERADLLTEMKLVKYPFEKNVTARERVEY
ncbi:cob(I)yrinic acid a,c-diamide adenosyltransferase [Methanosarcina sp. WH1]|nr:MULTISPECIES: cob(I)yrinic acid a,c-diamide adenosyltransferase [unclassified Methanosarcina]